MAKLNKTITEEDSVKKSKKLKTKNKFEKSDAPKSKKPSAKPGKQSKQNTNITSIIPDPGKVPPKKQIAKKPKIKNNGMKNAVKLIAKDRKHKKQPTTPVAIDEEAEDTREAPATEQLDENTSSAIVTPVQKKKSKHQKKSNGVADEEIREPTAAELLESEKPENTKAIITVRQKKKLKHQKRLEEQKNKNPNKEIARNEEYLLKWKNNRDEWKFEKLRQIGVQLSVFDDTKISAEVWPIALEYLSGSKGAAKEKITKAAEAVIDELDKEAEKATDGDSTLITSSEKYRRARELLQSFD